MLAKMRKGQFVQLSVQHSACVQYSYDTAVTDFSCVGDSKDGWISDPHSQKLVLQRVEQNGLGDKLQDPTIFGY